LQGRRNFITGKLLYIYYIDIIYAYGERQCLE